MGTQNGILNHRLSPGSTLFTIFGNLTLSSWLLMKMESGMRQSVFLKAITKLSPKRKVSKLFLTMRVMLLQLTAEMTFVYFCFQFNVGRKIFLNKDSFKSCHNMNRETVALL